MTKVGGVQAVAFAARRYRKEPMLIKIMSGVQGAQSAALGLVGDDWTTVAMQLVSSSPNGHISRSCVG